MHRDDDLEADLTSLLNRYSQENKSGTPDFVLSWYLLACLEVWNTAVVMRGNWRNESVEETQGLPIHPDTPFEGVPMRWELKNGEPNRMKTAKQAVVDYISDELGKKLHVDDMYIVWFCKTLQNWKALVSTDSLTDQYFEVTYNGDKNEMYLDHYTKVLNEVILMEPFNAS